MLTLHHNTLLQPTNDLPSISLASPFHLPCNNPPTLISDKTMAIGKKMRTFALY